MEKFIKTSDQELAEELRKAGFKELKSQGKFFVFVNNGKYTFCAEQEKKIVYTNMLTMERKE